MAEVEDQVVAEQVVCVVGPDIDGDVPCVAADIECQMLMILRFLVEALGRQLRRRNDFAANP